MKQFINSKDTLITEAIDGLLRSSGDRLARLDAYPDIKVVVRADWDKSRVAIISGGGSGHEPAHAGFVGAGLLTAAVCGEVFASPSVDAVLAAIMAVSGAKGCLLVVKNYTGDRLNFGLAAERARALGVAVEMVVVADDIALPDINQPRGVAGTLFVHKIAGALAESGASLKQVSAAAKRVSGNIDSFGMSLDTCSVPGSPKEQRIDEGMVELGLGIHGEPGVEQIEFNGAQQAVQIALQRLQPGAAEHVALLNNLGGLTALEMGVLAEELARSELSQQVQWLLGPAALMTSLDMRGFSLSLLSYSAEDLRLLQEPCASPYWPSLSALAPIKLQAQADYQLEPTIAASEHPQRRQLLAQCCTSLIELEAELNALDAKSGDGDTGSTLATAARALQAHSAELAFADIGDLYQGISMQLSKSMGGSSGVLLAIFFAAAADAHKTGADLVASLQQALGRVSEVGGAVPGDRTMIDALQPALQALAQDLAAAAAAARAGADATGQMTQARAGRASYVAAANLSGVNDPGAEAVARLFEALANH